ncbi:MAG: methyltransferase family protein, partial [Candidatus Zixiibacteriota bacterium]
LMALGFALWLWCVMLFRKAKTSPVPVRLPRQLVTKGPYALTRNPMLTGLFSFLTGLGFFLNSISMVLGWTPVFMVLNVIELKLVEEPGLERRFGDSYREYKRRVPMLIPRLSGVNKNGK